MQIYVRSRVFFYLRDSAFLHRLATETPEPVRRLGVNNSISKTSE